MSCLIRKVEMIRRARIPRRNVSAHISAHISADHRGAARIPHPQPGVRVSSFLRRLVTRQRRADEGGGQRVELVGDEREERRDHQRDLRRIAEMTSPRLDVIIAE